MAGKPTYPCRSALRAGRGRSGSVEPHVQHGWQRRRAPARPRLGGDHDLVGALDGLGYRRRRRAVRVRHEGGGGHDLRAGRDPDLVDAPFSSGGIPWTCMVASPPSTTRSRRPRAWVRRRRSPPRARRPRPSRSGSRPRPRSPRRPPRDRLPGAAASPPKENPRRGAAARWLRRRGGGGVRGHLVQQAGAGPGGGSRCSTDSASTATAGARRAGSGGSDRRSPRGRRPSPPRPARGRRSRTQPGRRGPGESSVQHPLDQRCPDLVHAEPHPALDRPQGSFSIAAISEWLKPPKKASWITRDWSSGSSSRAPRTSLAVSRRSASASVSSSAGPAPPRNRKPASGRGRSGGAGGRSPGCGRCPGSGPHAPRASKRAPLRQIEIRASCVTSSAAWRSPTIR